MLKSKRKKNKLPLGTLGWPFIGETIEFVSHYTIKEVPTKGHD